jgi:predicted PurR-regulated permease PerM
MVALFFTAAVLIHHTFSAILTSLVLAYLVNPLLKKMEALGLRRTPAITLIYLMLALGGTIAALLVVPAVSAQVSMLQGALPAYLQSVRNSLEVFRVDLAGHIGPEDSAWLVSRIDQLLAQGGREISGLGYQQLKGLLYTTFNLILAPILVFFMLFYKERAGRAILLLTPLRFRDELVHLGSRIHNTLERFILALLLDCLLVGIMCSLALWLLDIDFFLLNGMLAGFAAAVPFVGPLLAFIPPAVIGYSISGDPMMIVKVAAAYALIHILIEGGLIKPLLMRGVLKLNPLWVIFTVMAMGELMRIWGVLLSIPLLAVLKICAGEMVEYLERQG